MSIAKPEKPTLWDVYQEGDFIDAKDNQADWRVGYIVAKVDHSKTFKVRFDGWSSKYDETYKFNSYKLQPFRSIVIGYTGQVQNPAVREDWKFVVSQHQQHLAKLKELIAAPQKFSAHELNQQLRGHIYMYTDFLMTYKFHSQEGVAHAIDFFKANVTLLAHYLKTIDANFGEYFASISVQKDIEQWNSREAYFRSYFEVFDTCYTIWGCYNRLQGFFRDNGDLIKAHFEEEESKIEAKRMMQTQMTQLLIKFDTYQVISSITEKLLNYEQSVPFLFLHSLTNLLTAVYSLVNHNDKELIIQRVIKIGDNNLSKLKDSHLKELHKHHVSNFLNALVQFSLKTKFQDAMMEWTTQRELQLSLKLIMCPFFQKKLKGIAYMIQILEKNDFVLKNGFFKKWAERTNLYDILFLNSDNQEFTKKSCELAKYLFIKNNLTEDNIDLIIKSRTGKHETVLKEIYSLLAEFALYESNHQLKLKLYNKVANLPEEHWDEDYIHMIRELSENAFGLNLKEKLVHPFGFYLVYEYAVKVESDFALGQLLHILHRVEKSSIYNQFQKDCFQKIEKQQKTWIHIKILLMICNNRIDTFDKLEINLIKILVQSILGHSSTDQTKIIEDGLELLTEVTRNTVEEIEVEQMGLLWKHLISSEHRETFLRWLFKKKDNGRVSLNHSLTQKHRKYLLESLWNTPEEIKEMNQSEAIFMIELFKSVNIVELKMNRVLVIIRPTSFELEAYEKIWDVLRQTQNQSVAALLCDLLAEVHTCYEEENLTQSIQNLIENLSLNIKDSMERQDITYLTRMLQLTQKLVLRDEQIFTWTYSPRVNYFREYTVVSRDTNESKTFRFNCMSTFYQLKKVIGERFNIPLYKLIVYNSKQEEIKLESYFKSVNELMISSAKLEIAENVEYQSIVKICLNRKLDMFLQLLDDHRIEKIVWSIVEKLPISDDVKFRLVETEDILGELSKSGFYKELYELKVVLELPQEWWSKFVRGDNLLILMNNFGKVNFKTHIELQFLGTLSQIIGKMLRINEKEEKEIQIPENLVLTVFETLKTLLTTLEKEGSKSVDLQVKIIQNLFQILQNLRHEVSHSICQQLLNYKQCQNLLILGLIKIPQAPIRNTIYQQLRGIFEAIEEPAAAQGYLELLLIKILELVVSLPNNKMIKEYFQFTSYFLSLLTTNSIRQFRAGPGKELCQKIFKLATQEQPQQSAEAPNMHLVGYLSLLKYFVASEEREVQQDIANFIVHKCLFADNQSICKTKSSRAESFSLLRIIICYNSQILEKTCSYISSLHKTGQWRSKKLDDWTITLLDKMKSSTGFVGIKNLGCICYMNSFMQQLFMIPRFRHAITSCQDPNFLSEIKEQNLLYQVQKMFLNLWASDKKFYNPKEFCHAFKDYQGNPTNLTQQMDIDEFSNVLFDRLQNQMKDTNRPTLIKEMFGGVFSNEIVCKGCPHYSQTEEHFLSISLTVKNKKNIYQSFDTMIKGDTLDADNAYFCERCNKKVSAVKRVSLKQLPDYLIVTLKRFEFDYEKMIKLKVNDYCEFPINLKLREYSRQFLRKQESTQSAELDEEEILPNDYFNYVLKGVVVHLGYADSGHYYSYSQDRKSGRWFEFNDTIVRPFNIDDIAEQTFGGETSGYESKQKIKNAYMLIYQREKKLSVEKQLSISKEEILSIPDNAPTLQEIFADNKEQKIQNILFSHQYSFFVQELLETLPRFEDDEQKLILKYIITVYLTITTREKSDGAITSLLKKIYTKCLEHNDIKEWVISLFSERRVFEEFFKNCLIREVKKTLAYWLADLYQQCSTNSQEYFLNMILTKLTEDNENCLEYCLMLFQISMANPKSLDYLVSKGVVGRYIQNIIRKDPRIFVQKLQVLPECDSQIGNEIVFQKTQSDTLKKLRLDNENGYIWALINLIIRRARQLNLPLDSYLSEVEVGYLKLTDSKIYKILQQIKSKFQMYQFLELLCYLSLNDKEMIVMLIKHIMQGLKDFQSKRYRQFFILFEKLINVQDEFQDLRLQGFRSLQEGLIHNEKYSLDSNIIQQWIIILINRNQHLRSFVQADRNSCSFLMKFATKKIPSDEVARKNSVYADFMINKLHGIKFPKSKKSYAKLSEEIANFYEILLSNCFEESNAWPSVPETETTDLKVGDVVAYFDTKDKIDYEEAKVESIFLGRVELQIKKGRLIQVWKDDEKISLDVKLVRDSDQSDLNSSRTTEMEMEDDEDYFDDNI